MHTVPSSTLTSWVGWQRSFVASHPVDSSKAHWGPGYTMRSWRMTPFCNYDL